MTAFTPEPPVSNTEAGSTLPRRRKRHRSLFVLLLGLVIVWSAAMVFRWELRAQWWAYQVTHATSPIERDYYVTCLASIGDKSENVLHRLTRDERPEIREAAITILRFCKQPQAADRLFELLADESPDLAALAASTLAWQPDAQQHVPRLRAALSANPVDARAWGCAVALGRIGGEQAEAALCDVLARSCPPDVKAQVIDSLGLLGCRQAVPLITDALSDHRPIRVLPHSQLSARKAIQALHADLVAQGTDPISALAAVTAEPTVSGVAARWISLLAEPQDNPPTTQPFSRRPVQPGRAEQDSVHRPAAHGPRPGND